MEEEIKAEFNKIGFALEDEEEILKKCKILSFVLLIWVPIAKDEYTDAAIYNPVDLGLAFCINYNLMPSDIVSSWEVYYLNRFTAQSLIYVIILIIHCLLSEKMENYSKNA